MVYVFIRFFLSLYVFPYLLSVPISYALSHAQKPVTIYIFYCRKLRNMIRKSGKLTIAIYAIQPIERKTQKNTPKVIELNGEQCTDELAK